MQVKGENDRMMLMQLSLMQLTRFSVIILVKHQHQGRKVNESVARFEFIIVNETSDKISYGGKK